MAKEITKEKAKTQLILARVDHQETDCGPRLFQMAIEKANERVCTELMKVVRAQTCS